MAIKITKLGEAFGLGKTPLEAIAEQPAGGRTFNRKAWERRQKRNKSAKASRRYNRRQRRGQRR